MTDSNRPTLYDVARKAHVSHGTVPRVINDRPNVAPHWPTYSQLDTGLNSPLLMGRT